MFFIHILNEFLKNVIYDQKNCLILDPKETNNAAIIASTIISILLLLMETLFSIFLSEFIGL